MRLTAILFSLSILVALTEEKKAVAAPAMACFNVEGMTCVSCSLTLKTAVKKLDGIQDVFASVEDKEARATFDEKLTSAKKIQDAINSVGYKASAKQCKVKEG